MAFPRLLSGSIARSLACFRVQSVKMHRGWQDHSSPRRTPSKRIHARAPKRLRSGTAVVTPMRTFASNRMTQRAPGLIQTHSGLPLMMDVAA